MPDFLEIVAENKKDCVDIYPDFYTCCTDVMIRGKGFYAVYDENTHLWSRDESKAIEIINNEVYKFVQDHYPNQIGGLRISDCSKSSSRGMKNWNYFKTNVYDRFHELDENVKFANDPIVREDYATHVLPYSLNEGPTNAWDTLVGTLYDEENKHIIEWAIGAVATGASKDLQKFFVFYGAPGTGKSTVLNFIEDMFQGYTSIFDAKSLGSGSDSFALEAFKNNPLIAIQQDGDLSRIEDNTRLNSLSSHEYIQINEKFKAKYSMRVNTMLMMGTNKPVKITDAKSGILRRLIDIEPTGNTLPRSVYEHLKDAVKFEYGAIVWKCKEVFLKDPGYYDSYRPSMMMGTTNDFYNFVLESYDIFDRDDMTTLKQAWVMYKNYCEEAKVPYPYSMRAVKDELKNYFHDYFERKVLNEERVRNLYTGFRREFFEVNGHLNSEEAAYSEPENQYTINLKHQASYFDMTCASYPAQYANEDGYPTTKWDFAKTKLYDLVTTKLHYVKIMDIHHIVIDFDLKDANGNKSLALNLKAASKWPPTYAEVSKGGQGLHLHYIYDGDPEMLSMIFDDNIEIKVFKGNSSLRRKLTMCNDLPIATISSGLPLKGDKKVVNTDQLENERHLRVLVKKALNKEIHSATAPCMDFIKMITDKAYAQSKDGGFKYDITDLRPSVLAFAASSTHQSERCIKLCNDISWKSDEITSDLPDWPEDTLVFFDVEVFTNLFIVCYKAAGKENHVVKLIQPTRNDIEQLIRYKLIGFNNKRYDNHMLYAWLMGYSNEQLFELSKRIVANSKNVGFSEAYNIGYTDIFDFSAKKQSLKKWEIEMGIHHQEFGYPWDQPLAEEHWAECAEYCANDVEATEALFEHLQADWTARQILAAVTGKTVNDSTNQLTAAFIFGKGNKKPQGVFNYRDLAQPVKTLSLELEEYFNDVTCMPMHFSSPQNVENIEDYFGDIPFELESKIPYFPGYVFTAGKSTYRGDQVGEGGYVYAEPGMYKKIALLDIASMHPTSAECECLFGPEFTRRFHELKYTRVLVKHKQFDEAAKLFDGALAEFMKDPAVADNLAYALKIAINSVYGMTSASFDNPFRDNRNKDNIVAKRGALFMIDLKNEVKKRGFTVAHIKTDSIKIPDATPEIIKFVMDFGKYYGYTFEHEATYDRMCLVNDAVYIAKYATAEWCEKEYGYIPSDIKKHPGEWTATGAQFAVPYVFKSLFSHEDISFEDMCETKSVQAGAIYMDFNENLKNTENDEKLLKKLEKKDDTPQEEIDALKEKIAAQHDYQFVGKVGQFCPVVDGAGGGYLLRFNEGAYAAVTGTKGQRWIESEVLRKSKDTSMIDISYYEKLVNAARDTMAEYGNVEDFCKA